MKTIVHILLQLIIVFFDDVYQGFCKILHYISNLIYEIIYDIIMMRKPDEDQFSGFLYFVAGVIHSAGNCSESDDAKPRYQFDREEKIEGVNVLV